MSEAKKQDKKSYKTIANEKLNGNTSKNKSLSKNERVNLNNQLRINKLNTMLLKKRGIIDKDGETTINSVDVTNISALIDNYDYTNPPKTCVIIKLNEEADIKSIFTNLETIFENKHLWYTKNTNNSIPDNASFVGIIPNSIVKCKERINLIISPRNIHSCLDYCKIADLIVFVSSSKANHDCKKLNKDPYTSVNPIDNIGYETLSAIRAQCLPNHIAIIQDLDLIDNKYRSDFKKLYTRYFQTELLSEKILVINNKFNKDEYCSLLRTITTSYGLQDTSNNLRKHRSYMLCHKAYNENNNIVVEGYIRGNTIGINSYCSLTGFGNYLVLNVQDEDNDPCPSNIKHVNNVKNKLIINQNNIINIEDINIDKKITNDYNIEKGINNNPTVIGDKLNEIKSNNNNNNNLHTIIDKGLDDLINLNLNNNCNEDISFDEEKDINNDEEKLIKNLDSYKHKQKASVYYRASDDMEVADEVDTPIDVMCKERYSKYRGLSSMKPGTWDPTINLPNEYSNIFSFENMPYTKKESIKKAHNEGLKLSGKYVKITLNNYNNYKSISFDINKPLILSSLLEHENKLCVMHLKVKINDDYINENNSLFSKELVEVHIGFRRYIARPLYSSIIGESDKFKKERKLEKNKYMIASIYSEMTYPDAPVMLFKPSVNKSNNNNTNLNSNNYYNFKLAASGVTIATDCNKIILKKIVLTGYPLKIHKKKSVIRYMFFNPEDINYFKPIPLHTKHGLRGNIVESLGTHGYMKCTFNDTIKANDTVCLPLYKRCFPIWLPETWKYNIKYSDDNIYIEKMIEDSKECYIKELKRLQGNTEEVNKIANNSNSIIGMNIDS